MRIKISGRVATEDLPYESNKNRRTMMAISVNSDIPRLVMFRCFVLFANVFVAAGAPWIYPYAPDVGPDKSDPFPVFPDSFAFGASTSAYQIEGGWLSGGKGFSIWDAFSHIPGNIANGDTGDVAIDHYNRFHEDVLLLQRFGVKHYRFSIAWTRIMPTGVEPVNEQGVKFYNDLINALIDAGITPYVTLFHSDMPLALQLRNGNAFLLPDFPKLFSDYARVVFRSFGDRVKTWFTFNEPWCSAVLGTSGGEVPYQIAHSILLAHAEAVAVYRSEFKSQLGAVGIVLNTAHFFPGSTHAEDVASALRSYDFNFNWFAQPIYGGGDYPDVMRRSLGQRLPTFTAEQRKKLNGSADFIAINIYSASINSPGTTPFPDPSPTFWSDINVTSATLSSWPTSDMGWAIVPEGMRGLLRYLSSMYKYPIYITENGVALQETSVESAVNDTSRSQFIHDHIKELGKALTVDNVDVRGYFVWSIFDNLEWGSGFTKKFGMVHVDHSTLDRTPKHSLYWYKSLIDGDDFVL